MKAAIEPSQVVREISDKIIDVISALTTTDLSDADIGKIGPGIQLIISTGISQSLSSVSLQQRFIKIVEEMDADIQKLELENSQLKSKFRILNFPSEQATNCGKCGKYKHTPWKDDDYGYVCPTCQQEIADERDVEIRRAAVDLILAIKNETSTVLSVPVSRTYTALLDLMTPNETRLQDVEE